MKKNSRLLLFILILSVCLSLFASPALAAEGPVAITCVLHQGDYARSAPAMALLGEGGPLVAIRDLAGLTGSEVSWQGDVAAVAYANHTGFALMSNKTPAIYKVEGTVAAVAAHTGTGEMEAAAGGMFPETSASSGGNRAPAAVAAAVTWTYKKIPLSKPLETKGGVNYLPFSYLQSLGYGASWDNGGKTLHITVAEGVYLLEAPQAKISQAKEALKKDRPTGTLGSYTTYYKTSQYNRTVNVELAARAINGTVVQPGQVFSFNQTVGPRTTARGYRSAIVFSSGQQVYGIGGGICQVSSTLYNAVMNAKLQTVERWPHSLPVSYVPSGKDASVSWGSADYRFKNTGQYPVKVVTSVGGGTLKISIVYA